MKKVVMECTLFYKKASPKEIELLIINDTNSSYSLVKESTNLINDLLPTVVSGSIMNALVTGLNANGYKQIENSYDLY